MKKEECISCKIISVCTFVGIGGYLCYISRKQPSLSKYSLIVLGTAAASIGIMQITNKSFAR